jgi:polyketide synthase PksN
MLSSGQFISSEGHCQSFGEGGDGYIPGEGVGVVILKRLIDAESDGDHIYGLLRGSALNHGGKTNGYTVPNPHSQSSAIRRALKEANINARHISYIEAHGTGTKLGDPIEISSMSKAFSAYTDETGFCLIGSAKSNIGHCESAAGIAGLTKVLLQMKHGQIVPSLHSSRLNPNIDFSATPFVVNQALTDWDHPIIEGISYPRIAGISSFGAGGSNAHLIVEEYSAQNNSLSFSKGINRDNYIVVLSARTDLQLTQKVRDLFAFLLKAQSSDNLDSINLSSLIYTLQVGREAMDERLGFLVDSTMDLLNKLRSYLDSSDLSDVFYRDQVRDNRDTIAQFNSDPDLQETIDKWVVQQKYSNLLYWWVKGLDFDWYKLYGESKPLRMSLPVYPFSRESYRRQDPLSNQSLPSSVLHPLLHTNTSTITEQSYSSVFSGQEDFIKDHQVNGQKILPGVAYIKMVLTAIRHAIPNIEESNTIELQNIVWIQPFIVLEKKEIIVSLSLNEDGIIHYRIYSCDDRQEVDYSQGEAIIKPKVLSSNLSIEQLKIKMNGKLESTDIYSQFAKMGLDYGATFQGITTILQGEKELLVQLNFLTIEKSKDDFLIWIGIVDSALQSSIGLYDDLSKITQLPLPFSLESLSILSPITESMFAWVRHSSNNQSEDSNVTKLDIDLCDPTGIICIQIRGFATRLYSNLILPEKQNNKIELLLATPVWEHSTIKAISRLEVLDFIERYVILYGIPHINPDQLEKLMQNTYCTHYTVLDKNIAELYNDFSSVCFETLQGILKNKLQGKVHVQVIIPNEQQNLIFAGLSGLLKTAMLENPQLTGQIIFTSFQIDLNGLVEQLQENLVKQEDTLVKYEQESRYITVWKEIEKEPENLNFSFKNKGVYIITGGLGKLGILFAREIFNQTKEAKVILTGRSEKNEKIEVILNTFPNEKDQLVYKQLDINNSNQVVEFINEIIEENKQINGIIHSAGMTADNFILNKPSSEFKKVLFPKVEGTFILDEATKDIKLDFMVLFSSITSAMGNLGQSDYAVANGFLDQFSTYRNQLVNNNERYGHTLSINWPLWEDGGMHIEQINKDILKEMLGVIPMKTETGIFSFYKALSLGYDQILVMEGILPKMRNVLQAVRRKESEVIVTELNANTPIDTMEEETLVSTAQDFLRKLFSEVLGLSFHEINTKTSFEKYGIDSIFAMSLTNKLEKTFGLLSKTLFFEYQTISALAKFLTTSYPNILREKVKERQLPAGNKTNIKPDTIKRSFIPDSKIKNRSFLNANSRNDIAIIGISGKYPQANNLEEFWENLKNGKDSITEIPSERWDNTTYFNPNRNQAGKSYSKWGGFISDVDKFDPLFFNISPKEAELMDPQERLFIETVWNTIEDAGYDKESISAQKIGVYVGVMYGQYQLYGAEAMLAGNSNVPGSSFASIANRVSYFFDLRGPSIALDTMCSSSITAIHLACEEIRKGEIDAAIAGGVNVSIHPHKYLILSQGNFASSDGRCRSFGEGGDGYVAGEGVGAILLKSLDKAIQDGDNIYGVIKSSVLNHGGKTNGYTVPSPVSQGDLILEALNKAKIDPGTLSYIEAHGTGTSLGDPIEIVGLKKAFEKYSPKKQFCSIGSVKSNIGHLEAAAGIAALTKVLLQLKHQQLVPSLHADPLNPNINFNDSPFYVQKELVKWESSSANPRRAGISSFGAGGSNAHLIIEEYIDENGIDSYQNISETEIFILSARDLGSLIQYAKAMISFIENNRFASFKNVAYTSQVGRTPMNERLAIVATSLDDLKDKLSQWVSCQENKEIQFESNNILYGIVKNGLQSNTADYIDGDAGAAFLQVIINTRDLLKLGKLWTSGVEIDWSRLYSYPVKRVSIPTYPFKKERYWFNLPLLDVYRNQKKISHIQTQRGEVEKVEKIYYTSEWEEKAIDTSDQNVFQEPILFFSTSENLYFDLKKQLADNTTNKVFIWIKPDQEYKEIAPNKYTINIEREDDFNQLIKSLDIKEISPRQIIYDNSIQEIAEDKNDIKKELSKGLYALFYLCKSLIKQKKQNSLQILFLFSSNLDIQTSLNEALSGFFKTLTLEYPKYQAKTIGIENLFEDKKRISTNIVDLVLDELKDSSWWQNEIRYKFNKNSQLYTRYVKKMTPLDLPDNKLHELPLKQNGVYIVSGALGGLGFIICEYLARKFQSKLILLGRSALKAEQEKKLNSLKVYNAECIYIQADVSSSKDVELAIKEAKTRFSSINGIIHSAGINKDSFILNKSKEDIEKVIESKIYGTINLDDATKNEDLDLFVLFSSIAGIMGNIGQSDYAYGNHFVDSFAEKREILRKSGKRFGKTLSINWPYWEEGGMSISQDEFNLIKNRTGIYPLSINDGIQFYEDFLRLDTTQGIALYGDSLKIRTYIQEKSIRISDREIEDMDTVDISTLMDETQLYLKKIIGKEIKLSIDRIDSTERFEAFGIDSIIIGQINADLETDLGNDLPKTLFYQYETIEEVASYLVREAQKSLLDFFNINNSYYQSNILESSGCEVLRKSEIHQKKEIYSHSEPIAIIGVHGYYPQSENLDQYWENLKQGKDLITTVPSDRWDYRKFYDMDPEKASMGKIYCKWGGFVDDADKFDPSFFNISEEEAKVIDPQERMFLESVWSAIEDAGYTRETLKRYYPKGKSANVGVFVGVTTNSYNLLGAQDWDEAYQTTPSSLPWSIANRVSYFFDFQGPSIPVDTACSSSLVALHLACENLRRSDCQVAIAGGVNLYLHPSKFHSFCKKRMLAIGGKCRSYGAGDDGFIPGEGVGTVILKPLSKAIEDQDRIYAVITGSAYEHSGRSNGYSAPNPNSQAELISDTIKKGNIDPETITYIEGHGTGTQIGDNLEIVSLTNAFRKQTHKKQYCSVGSVKANIGHSESAAGIAGVTKVLLQMKNKQLVPTIHSEEINPNIDFSDSPFFLQHNLSSWEVAGNVPRRALVNSFGAGGVNACVILEEYSKTEMSQNLKEYGPYLIVLSAKNKDRLEQVVDNLLNYINKEEEISMTNLAYTLQIGREAMDEKLAIVVSNKDELIDGLKNWKQQKTASNIYYKTAGSLYQKREISKQNKEEDINVIYEKQNLDQLAYIWLEGKTIDWERLYSQNKPVRINLPTYPFSKKRYWVSDALLRDGKVSTGGCLHPLVSYNSSSFQKISFSSLLLGNEFYALDHQVNKQSVFPGAAFLEIANISGNIAKEEKVTKIKDIVWIHPLKFEQDSQIVQTFLKNNKDSADFQIVSFDDENDKIIHTEGKLFFQNSRGIFDVKDENISIELLKQGCSNCVEGSHYYNLFEKIGLYYGPSFQTMKELYINESFALAKLEIGDSSKSNFDQFILHPSIIDGAFQAVAGLMQGSDSPSIYLPFAIDELEIIRHLPQTCYAYVKPSDYEINRDSGVRKFDIKILNEKSEVLIKIKNFHVRTILK